MPALQPSSLPVCGALPALCLASVISGNLLWRAAKKKSPSSPRNLEYSSVATGAAEGHRLPVLPLKRRPQREEQGAVSDSRRASLLNPGGSVRLDAPLACDPVSRQGMKTRHLSSPTNPGLCFQLLLE